MPSKWMETMIKKLGSEEAVREHMSQLAKKRTGTKNPKGGVAALNKEERSRRGREAANKRWNNKK